MLTLIFLLLIFGLAAAFLLVITTIGIIAWPILLIIGFGLIVDIIAFKILRRKKH